MPLACVTILGVTLATGPLGLLFLAGLSVGVGSAILCYMIYDMLRNGNRKQ